MGVSGEYHSGYHGFQGEFGQGTLKSTPVFPTGNQPPPPLRGRSPFGGLLPLGGPLPLRGPPTPPKGLLPPLGGQAPLP